MAVTEPNPGARSAATQENDFQPLIANTASDRCSQCGSEMAADQRYCVECGTRRGGARFSLPAGGAAAAGAPPAAGAGTAAVAADGSGGRKPRTISSSAALLATIALLLLAMGVGVLIGNSGNHGSGSAQKISVVESGGGSAPAAAATPATAGTAAASSTPAAGSTGGSAAKSTKKASSSSAKSSSSPAATTTPGGTLAPKHTTVSKHATKAQRHQALQTQMTQTVALKSGKHLASQNQKLGSKCTQGTEGCSKSGKLNGTFFSSGG